MWGHRRIGLRLNVSSVHLDYNVLISYGFFQNGNASKIRPTQNFVWMFIYITDAHDLFMGRQAIYPKSNMGRISRHCHMASVNPISTLVARESPPRGARFNAAFGYFVFPTLGVNGDRCFRQ